MEDLQARLKEALESLERARQEKDREREARIREREARIARQEKHLADLRRLKQLQRKVQILSERVQEEPQPSTDQPFPASPNKDEIEANLERIRHERLQLDEQMLSCPKGSSKEEELQKEQDLLDREEDNFLEELQGQWQQGDSDDGMSDAESDENQDFCRACREGGYLLCCDRCKASYHFECVRITEDSVGEGEWHCGLVNKECLVKSKYFEDVVHDINDRYGYAMDENEYKRITEELEKAGKLSKEVGYGYSRTQEKSNRDIPGGDSEPPQYGDLKREKQIVKPTIGTKPASNPKKDKRKSKRLSTSSSLSFEGDKKYDELFGDGEDLDTSSDDGEEDCDKQKEKKDVGGGTTGNHECAKQERKSDDSAFIVDDDEKSAQEEEIDGDHGLVEEGNGANLRVDSRPDPTEQQTLEKSQSDKESDLESVEEIVPDQKSWTSKLIGKWVKFEVAGQSYIARILKIVDVEHHGKDMRGKVKLVYDQGWVSTPIIESKDNELWVCDHFDNRAKLKIIEDSSRKTDAEKNPETDTLKRHTEDTIGCSRVLEPSKGVMLEAVPFDLWDEIYFPENNQIRQVNSRKTEKRRKLRSSSSEREIIDLTDLTAPEETAGKQTKRKHLDRGTQQDDSRQKRRNIREILDDSALSVAAKRAQKEEMERLKRISERKKKLASKGLVFDQRDSEITLNSPHSNEKSPLYIAKNIAGNIKAHQIEGIHFIWDNIVESTDALQEGNPGKGCILSHLMGLGKTLQAVAFIHGFLHYELGRHVLVVGPVNVLENWRDEFDLWLNEDEQPNVYGLHKVDSTVEARLEFLNKWKASGGVLLLGFDIMTALCGGKGRGKQGSNPERGDESSKRVAEFRELLLKTPDLAVLDEGHRIKNDKTGLSVVLKDLVTKRRIVLTGTPMQNNLEEYYHMIDFVRPDELGSKETFRNQFVNPIRNGRCVDSDERDIKRMKRRIYVLHKKTMGFIHRRGYKHVAGQMPKKYEFTIFIKMTKLQKRLYKRYQSNHVGKAKTLLKIWSTYKKVWDHPYILLRQRSQDSKRSSHAASGRNQDKMAHTMPNAGHRSDTASDVDVGTNNKFSLVERGSDLNTNRKGPAQLSTSSIWRHMPQDSQQVLVDSNLKKTWFEDILPLQTRFEDASEDQSGKLQIGMALMRKIISMKEKVLFFANSKAVFDIVESCLDRSMGFRLGRDYLRLEGSVTGASRHAMVKKFNSDTRVHVFMISTKAGGVGINLVSANHAIIYDVNWNPSHNLQAIYRIFRFGQRKTCHVYRLVASGTMEQGVYERCITKEGMAARVVDKKHVRSHFLSKSLEDLDRVEYDDEDPSSEGSKGSDTKMEPDRTSGSSATDAAIDKIDQRRTLYNPYENKRVEVPPDSLMWWILSRYGSKKQADEARKTLLDRNPELDVRHEHRMIQGFHAPQIMLEHVEADRLTDADKLQAQAEFENDREVQSAHPTINLCFPAQPPPPDWPPNKSLLDYMRWGPKEITEYLDKLKIGHLKQKVLSYIQSGEHFLLLNKRYIKELLGITEPSDMARLLYGVLWLIQSKAHWSGRYEIIPYPSNGEVAFRERNTKVERNQLPAEFHWDLWLAYSKQ